MWSDDRYVHAVSAALTILDALAENPGIKRSELTGLLVTVILHALEEREAEVAHA